MTGTGVAVGRGLAVALLLLATVAAGVATAGHLGTARASVGAVVRAVIQLAAVSAVIVVPSCGRGGRPSPSSSSCSRSPRGRPRGA